MFRLLSALKNAWTIPELRRRLLFTLGILAVYELGLFIPVPGIDGKELGRIFDRLSEMSSGGLLNLLDMFTGGALSKATIFALGIMPYITATIIVETLLSNAIPAFEKLRKEGMSGYRKLHQYSRYATVALAVFNSFMYATMLETRIPEAFKVQIVQSPGLGFKLVTVLTMTGGMALIMWLAEQITERGIGNGMSLIMTASIVGRIPLALRDLIVHFGAGGPGRGNLQPIILLLLGAFFVFIVFAVIFVEQGQRRIPVQYARRVVGRKVYTGQSTYLPLRVNSGGVLPIIFAVSLVTFPMQIAGFVPQLRGLLDWFGRTSIFFNVAYAVLIFLFTYFSTALTAQEFIRAADDMKKYGAFIPGIRPGQPTVDHLYQILMRLTFVAAVYLIAIAILPDLLMAKMKIPFSVASFFGGTSLLIVVGVTLDTMKQIESHLLMRHYEGFFKSGRLRARR